MYYPTKNQTETLCINDLTKPRALSVKLRHVNDVESEESNLYSYKVFKNLLKDEFTDFV